MNPDISIVCLNFRTPDLTVGAAESARAACGGLSSEVIIVDNGSHDGSVEKIAREIRDAVMLELNENKGFACGMNTGMRQAMGEYILLLNSDIKAEGGSVEKLARYMKANPSVAIAAPALLKPDGKLGRSILIEPTPARVLFPYLCKVAYRSWQAKIKSNPLPVEVVEGAATLVSRRFLDTCGMLDEEFFFYCEIVDWCMRARSAGFQVALVPEVRMTHIGGASTAERAKLSRIEMRRSYYHLVQKHLGITMKQLAMLADGCDEGIKILFHHIVSSLSLGSSLNSRRRAETHMAILTWLAAGCPPRNDSRYERWFGKWD